MGQGKIGSWIRQHCSKGNLEALRSHYKMRWKEIHREVGSHRGLTTERAKAEALGSSTIAGQCFTPARSRTGPSPGPLCGRSRMRLACGYRDQAECGSSEQAGRAGRAWAGPRRLEPFSAQRLQPEVACWGAQGRAARTPVGEHRSSSTRLAHRTCTPSGQSGVWAARPDWTERGRTFKFYGLKQVGILWTSARRWGEQNDKSAYFSPSTSGPLNGRCGVREDDMTRHGTDSWCTHSHRLNGSRWDFVVLVLYTLDPAFQRLAQLNCK